MCVCVCVGGRVECEAVWGWVVKAVRMCVCVYCEDVRIKGILTMIRSVISACVTSRSP